MSRCLDPQTPPEKAFRGSKHLLTRYLGDFGRLGSKTPQNSASTVVLLERVSDESFIDQNNQNIPLFKVKDGLQNFKQGCRFGPESKPNPGFRYHFWLCCRKCIGDKSANLLKDWKWWREKSPKLLTFQEFNFYQMIVKRGTEKASSLSQTWT